VSSQVLIVRCEGERSAIRRALELIRAGTVQVRPFITHHYGAFEEIPRAFQEDFQRLDYSKGVLRLA
jgi:threonine dehydrogenase-like Zn-dependent dehydrogenase